MLKNISSSYIIKFIFSYIEEGIKLKLIKYNQDYQKKIDISIHNYKHFKEKYIIYDSKTRRKGKEYNCYDDHLEFEGEYLNGERNGKGKEYISFGGLIFEGEYLHGKRNGKGKEYYNDGKLKFEGEYLKNKKISGIKYVIRDGIVYEINFDRKIHYYNDELLNFENDNLFKNGKYYGYGLYEKDIIKSAYFNRIRRIKEKCNLYNHQCKMKYEGEHLYYKRHGKGKEYNYKGQLVFEGEYLYDFRIKGKFYVNEKLEYEGDYLYNKKWNGKGYDKYGNIIYEVINGNGKVKEYDWDGKLIYDGEYLNGKRI